MGQTISSHLYSPRMNLRAWNWIDERTVPAIFDPFPIGGYRRKRCIAFWWILWREEDLKN